MTIILRPVNKDDGPFLFDLYASTRKDEMAHWGWDEAQRQLFLKMQYTAQQQSYGAQWPDADHNIILIDDRRAGRILVARLEDQILLADIALLPEHRGCGAGTILIRELQAEATDKGKPVRLHVLKFNRAARLYERLGFSIIGDDGMYFHMEWLPAPDLA